MKIFYKILCILLLGCTSQLSAAELDQALQDAQFYFLMDADTKEVLLAKNADVRIPPSSMTKMMTAYVVFDQVKKGRISLHNQCLIGKDAWRKSGSSMFLNYGDVVSIDELVKGLLAISGNDAAIALAESTGNGIENFVDLMNAKAQEIGLKNSHFQNPHGLYDPQHYMSVRDLATLGASIYQNLPQYLPYFGISEFSYRRIKQYNHNPLIVEKYDGVIGGKTGFTNQGGYGVTNIVKHDHRTLVAVVNKSKTPRLRATAISALMNYGFENYKKIVIFEKNQTVAHLKTWLGEKSKVAVATKEQVAFNLPREKSLDLVRVKIKYKTPLYTPIAKGSQVATLHVEVAGYKNFEYPLFAQEEIEKGGYFKRINQIMRYKFSQLLN
ncbi:MAG: D-alanyl-D-alanine carboxypeptidase [Rickettsiales bacterium]|nr:D-alanyl-D-alanine carboxypeptidase [Rickettsiales bacterium]